MRHHPLLHSPPMSPLKKPHQRSHEGPSRRFPTALLRYRLPLLVACGGVDLCLHRLRLRQLLCESELLRRRSPSIRHPKTVARQSLGLKNRGKEELEEVKNRDAQEGIGGELERGVKGHSLGWVLPQKWLGASQPIDACNSTKSFDCSDFTIW